jgi:tripartite-type tricarboxylate transporter receptor subunit TctC
MKTITIRWLLVLSLGSLFAAPVRAQEYPAKPVRLVVAGVGSISDVVARFLAQGIGPGFGQQVIVDNRASGIIPVIAVAKAAPDGYTALVYGSVVWLASYLQEDVPFDPIRDFIPITLVTYSPNVLVVHPSLPVKSVKELVAVAKQKPGIMNYASSGPGSSSHLAGELFKSLARINVVRINYKTINTAYDDLATGQVQMMFATTGSVSNYLKLGRLRAIAVTSTAPSPLAPGLPTVAASGLPEFEAGSRVSLFVPAKTPDASVKRLTQESVRFLRTAEAREKFLNVGVEAVGSSPEELLAAMKSDMARMGAVIKAAGIRAQ